MKLFIVEPSHPSWAQIFASGSLLSGLRKKSKEYKTSEESRECEESNSVKKAVEHNMSHLQNINEIKQHKITYLSSEIDC